MGNFFFSYILLVEEVSNMDQIEILINYLKKYLSQTHALIERV